MLVSLRAWRTLCDSSAHLCAHLVRDSLVEKGLKPVCIVGVRLRVRLFEQRSQNGGAAAVVHRARRLAELAARDHQLHPLQQAGVAVLHEAVDVQGPALLDVRPYPG